jgi:hypothetical protein
MAEIVHKVEVENKNLFLIEFSEEEMAIEPEKVI